MAQRPKHEVRERFVDAALDRFGAEGFSATRMADVAQAAGSSTGNLYRYFPDKQALFLAAVPRELAVDLRERLRVRVEARGQREDEAYRLLSEEVLEHCIAHRRQVAVLLARDEGTPHEGFAEGLVGDLVEWALAWAAREGAEPGPERRFALERAYRAFVGSVAAALVAVEDDDALRHTIGHITAGHQAAVAAILTGEVVP